MAKKSYRANHQIIGLGGKDKVTNPGQVLELTEEQARSLADAVTAVIEPAEPAKPAKPKPVEVTDRHVRFLQSRGYRIDTIERAQSFVQQMSDEDKEGFFADAEAWKEPPPPPAKPRTREDLEKLSKAEIAAAYPDLDFGAKNKAEMIEMIEAAIARAAAAG